MNTKQTTLMHLASVCLLLLALVPLSLWAQLPISATFKIIDGRFGIPSSLTPMGIPGNDELIACYQRTDGKSVITHFGSSNTCPDRTFGKDTVVRDVAYVNGEVFFCGYLRDPASDEKFGFIGRQTYNGAFNTRCDIYQLSRGVKTVIKIIAYKNTSGGIDVVALGSDVSHGSYDLAGNILLHFTYPFASSMSIFDAIHSHSAVYKELWCDLLDCGSDVVVVGYCNDAVTSQPAHVIRYYSKSSIVSDMNTLNGLLLVDRNYHTSYPYAAWLGGSKIAFSAQSQPDDLVYLVDYTSPGGFLEVQTIPRRSDGKGDLLDMVFLPAKNKLVLSRTSSPNAIVTLTSVDPTLTVPYGSTEITPFNSSFLDMLVEMDGAKVVGINGQSVYMKDYIYPDADTTCFQVHPIQIKTGVRPMPSTIPACGPLLVPWNLIQAGVSKVTTTYQVCP